MKSTNVQNKEPLIKKQRPELEKDEEEGRKREVMTVEVMIKRGRRGRRRGRRGGRRDPHDALMRGEERISRQERRTHQRNPPRLRQRTRTEPRPATQIKIQTCVSMPSSPSSKSMWEKL